MTLYKLVMPGDLNHYGLLAEDRDDAARDVGYAFLRFVLVRCRKNCGDSEVLRTNMV